MNVSCYDSIGSMIKWYIKCRNKTITETAAAMNIKKTTFSAQLINSTVTADTLLRLAAYLDIDLEWMMIVLGKSTSGVVCPHLWTNYPRGRFF